MRPLIAFLAFILTSSVSALEGDDGDIYLAVVSFYSICCGPDPRDEKSVSIFIGDFEQKHKVKLKVHYPSRGQGPEGEWAMCFKLSEIDEAGQVEFVRGIQEALKQLRSSKNLNKDGGAEIRVNSLCM